MAQIVVRHTPTGDGRRCGRQEPQRGLLGKLHGRRPRRVTLEVCFINTLPVLQGFPWDRHAPAWLPEPAWSPAVPGGHWRRTYDMDI